MPDTPQPHDLSKTGNKPAALVKAEADYVAAQTRAEENAMKQVRAWDRAMQRAFKGIYTRAQRHAWLQRSEVPE